MKLTRRSTAQAAEEETAIQTHDAGESRNGREAATAEPSNASTPAADSRTAAVEAATAVARPRSRRLARPADDCERDGLL